MDTLTKQPSESRLYDMDFSANLSTSETITSVSSVMSDTAGLTIGVPVASGKKAQVRISGGTADVRYKLTFIVVTSAGNTLENDGVLQVTNK